MKRCLYQSQHDGRPLLECCERWLKGHDGLTKVTTAVKTLLIPTSLEKQQNDSYFWRVFTACQPHCSPNSRKISLLSLGFYAYCLIHTMKLNTRTCARGMSPWLNFTILVRVLTTQSRNILLHQTLHFGKIYYYNPPTRICINYKFNIQNT